MIVGGWLMSACSGWRPKGLGGSGWSGVGGHAMLAHLLRGGLHSSRWQGDARDGGDFKVFQEIRERPVKAAPRATGA